MQYFFPVSIVQTNAKNDVKNLLVQQPLQIGLQERITTVLQGGEYVILDFGKELSASVRIFTLGVQGSGRVHLRFGESVSETCSTLGVKGACNDHANRDFYVDLQNYSDMTFGNSGFRFLRVDTAENSTIVLKSVVACSNADERAEIGSFVCDDERVNEIWKTAAYTLRLCLQNGYFWDGIKRDRLVWIGDLYPEMRAAYCLFGQVPETDNSLTFAKNETPVGEWMGWIPNYNLWWLWILCEEYIQSQNRENLEKHLPFTKELLSYVSTFITKEGETTFPSDYIDWPTNYTEGEPLVKKADSHSGTFYLLRLTLQKVRTVFTAIGEDCTLVDDMLARLQKRSVKVEKYKQIAALGVLAGDGSENNQKLVLQGGAEGLSTFMSYPILTAMAQLGEYEGALAAMKTYYGGMLDLGATTFWEDFDLDWVENSCSILELPKAGQRDIHGDFGRYCYTGFRHSLCHGWSAGVIPYLMETVAGVRVGDDGNVTVKPHMSGLRWIKATFPTKDGVMKIEHRLLDNGEIQTKIEK